MKIGLVAIITEARPAVTILIPMKKKYIEQNSAGKSGTEGEQHPAAIDPRKSVLEPAGERNQTGQGYQETEEGRAEWGDLLGHDAAGGKGPSPKKGHEQQLDIDSKIGGHPGRLLNL